VKVNNNKEYAEFVDRKNEHFENMGDFKREIETQIDKVCGQNKGISNDPIRIRFFSKRVLDLLLVDLPGIVKVE
jgi:replication fork clamp-binding protein CrfC